MLRKYKTKQLNITTSANTMKQLRHNNVVSLLMHCGNFPGILYQHEKFVQIQTLTTVHTYVAT